MENKLKDGKVTVLIPTYKRPEKLKRAVDSVLNQSYQDFTIIISDNASGDETESVVNSLIKNDSRIEYHKQPLNIGMNPNFNFLVSKVATPFFCLLSDDDYYLPTFLEDAIKGFNNFPNIMFSVMSGPAVTENGNFIIDLISGWPSEGFYGKHNIGVLNQVTRGKQPIISACLFRNDIIPDFYFDTNVGYHSDLAVLILICFKYNFTLSKKTGMYFVQHHSNLSAQKLILQEEIKSRIAVWNFVLKNIDKDFNSNKILNKKKDRIFIEYLSKALATKDEVGYDLAYQQLVKSKSPKTKAILSFLEITIKFKPTKALFSAFLLLLWKTIKFKKLLLSHF